MSQADYKIGDKLQIYPECKTPEDNKHFAVIFVDCGVKARSQMAFNESSGRPF
jgi:hypothetical protein